MPLKIPRQVGFIVSTEACERFSYYGMLSILMLYLKNQLNLAEAGAKEVVHLFKMAVYFLPVAGALLADYVWGRYGTILSLSLFYCLGHATLALFEGQLWGIYAGLALIAIGAGGIKPCVSAFVGDQFAGDLLGFAVRVLVRGVDRVLHHRVDRFRSVFPIGKGENGVRFRRRGGKIVDRLQIFGGEIGNREKTKTKRKRKSAEQKRPREDIHSEGFGLMRAAKIV